MRSPECSDGEDSCRGSTQDDQDRAEWRKPPVLRAFLQTDLQACERNRKKCERRHVEGGQIRKPGSFAREQRWRGECGDHAGGDIDQKQPMPGPRVGDPATDHGPDRGRQHGHDAGHGGGNGMQTDRKQQEDRGKKPRESARPPAKP